MKIALCGSAPSSVNLAPYKDKDWQIWGCSPGAYPIAGPHADVWFELHRWEPQVAGHVGTGKGWFSPEYCEFLARFKGTVYMADPCPPEIANAEPVPVRALTDKYGPFFWTSSLSYMIAMAIEAGATEIGLWGVDMSAIEEYQEQRPGCWHFITLAKMKGITVTIPPESDLLQPPYWYGITENRDMMVKLTARMNELKGRHAAAMQREAAAAAEKQFLAGAIDDLDYMIKTWVTTQSWIVPTHGETGNEVRATNTSTSRMEAVPDELQYDGAIFGTD